MAQNQHGAAKAPDGNGVKLTGETNRQEFPARVTDDKAQEDNRRRVATVKQLDRDRELLPEEREAADARKARTLTAEGGTKVSVGTDAEADALKRFGFK